MEFIRTSVDLSDFLTILFWDEGVDGVGCGVDLTLSVSDPILGNRKGSSSNVVPATLSAVQESAPL